SLSLRELFDRTSKSCPESVFRRIEKRIGTLVLDVPEQRIVVAVRLIEARDPTARRILRDLVVLAERYTHSIRDLAVARFAAELRFDLANRRRRRTRLAVHGARRPVQLAKRIEHRTANAYARVRFEARPAICRIVRGGFQQA